jgi:hypothetical protein
MTPQEKAKELCLKFSTDGCIMEEEKRCALICCNEVLGYMGADRGTEFWSEVKQEIEKL